MPATCIEPFARRHGWPGRLSGALLAAVLFGFGLAPARGADTPAVMLIFDASGSMWGKLDGRTSKLASAREAVGRALPSLGQSTPVGLATFGHRRTGDCTDASLLLEPAQRNAGTIVAALERLNPKGKGPITLALTEALKVFGASKSGSVVLLHDNADNCEPAPCAAVEALHKQYPAVTIGVVSIAATPAEAQQMACLAGITGGKTYAADTHEGLDAAVQQAFADAVHNTVRPVPKPQPAPRAPPLEPGLHLAALLKAGGKPLDIPVTWRVTRASDADGVALFHQAAVAPVLTLDAGRYDVEARLWQAAARQTVTVEAGQPQQVNLALNAGTIRLTGHAERGAARLASPVFTIARPETSAAGVATGRPGEPLLVIRGSQAEIALQPGTYVVSVAHGTYRADRPIVVVAGSRGTLDLPLPTGEIELEATATNGGPVLDDVVFQVLEDDPDSPQGKREVARSAASHASFILPAGTYYVVARQGTAEARERVTVSPGESQRHTLVTQSAQLSLATTMAGGRIDSSDTVTYLVHQVGAKPSATLRTTRHAGAFHLAPGRYTVEGRLGPHNARVTYTVDLEPGTRNQVTVDHKAGVVRLKLLESEGSQASSSDVFWEIKDASGRIVWTTSEAQPLGILQAGQYAVLAEQRGRRFSGQIDVRAGDNRVVELVGK